MPAISYCKKNIEKYDFERKILQGIKIHTIRRNRKRRVRIGDILYHYNQQRSKNGHKICENTCLYVADIVILNERLKIIGNRTEHVCGLFDIFVNGKKICNIQEINIAFNDGFDNFQDFRDYFSKAGLPFRGQIIGWVEGINYA